MQALEQCFAREAGLAVIHPGWPAVHGRAEVLESFRRIVHHQAGPQPSLALSGPETTVQ